MAKWHAFLKSRPLSFVLLFLFGTVPLIDQTRAAGAPDNELFQLSIEANETDPRLCLFVVTAAEERFWTTLKMADEEQFQRVLSLKQESQTNGKLPTMLGRYQIKDRRLEFKPAFPLVWGGRYQAVFNPGVLKLTTKKPDQRLSKTYVIPLPDSQPPRVLAIYPSGKQLPANHLKFYIQFSEPMQQGEIFEYFSLFNKSQNQQVPRPFRHTELWSPDGRQLTLWFHPGRQKVGVNLNVELGAILNAGDEYELRINPKWAALSGHPLGTEIKKEFKAVTMDERQPKIAEWKFNTPRPGTLEPLVCELGEPLDYALLRSQLAIKNANGEPVPGKIELAAQESIWRFVPEKPWQAGRYQLVVGTVLEDLAGNSIARPFAIDLSQTEPTAPEVGEFVTREFLISK
ncbi:hypothetical protein [uncultured Gimesia sp.]|jgi:hypothetical protein|uniref:hypothetical protein n=1 Tax=uncultured Gimesia sp. TaxID=1678688 RepID=UPI002601C683|nr:hypothetical protein [uncultured Gimesia sp.]